MPAPARHAIFEVTSSRAGRPNPPRWLTGLDLASSRWARIPRRWAPSTVMSSGGTPLRRAAGPPVEPAAPSAPPCSWASFRPTCRWRCGPGDAPGGSGLMAWARPRITSCSSNERCSSSTERCRWSTICAASSRRAAMTSAAITGGCWVCEVRTATTTGRSISGSAGESDLPSSLSELCPGSVADRDDAGGDSGVVAIVTPDCAQRVRPVSLPTGSAPAGRDDRPGAPPSDDRKPGRDVRSPDGSVLHRE